MLDKIIKARRSIKKFKPQKPDWRDIIECIDAMRYAPMAGNNFSLKTILVDDEYKIKKIAEACQQQFISQAKSIVVVCTIPSRTKILFEEKGEVFLRQQAGAAIQNFLLKITEKKLATCWVGHFIESEIKHILNISKDVQIEALFPIGYPVKAPDAKRKISLDNILYFNEYKNKKMFVPAKLEV